MDSGVISRSAWPATCLYPISTQFTDHPIVQIAALELRLEVDLGCAQLNPLLQRL
jgi:hypothetical protein